MNLAEERMIQLERENAELRQLLRDKAAEKMPHSFVKMQWACGHECGATCKKCADQAFARLEAKR